MQEDEQIGVFFSYIVMIFVILAFYTEVNSINNSLKGINESLKIIASPPTE